MKHTEYIDNIVASFEAHDLTKLAFYNRLVHCAEDYDVAYIIDKIPTSEKLEFRKMIENSEVKDSLVIGGGGYAITKKEWIARFKDYYLQHP